jgi:hypothetical protein
VRGKSPGQPRARHETEVGQARHGVYSAVSSWWRGVCSAWPSFCEEGDRRGFGRPLGRTGLQARMGEGGRLGHSASAGPRGSGEIEVAGRARLGFQLSFSPQPK